MKGSLLFRFGTESGWIPLNVGLTSERTVRELYGHVQESSCTDYSDKLSLPEPAETFGMPLNTIPEDDLTDLANELRTAGWSLHIEEVTGRSD